MTRLYIPEGVPVHGRCELRAEDAHYLVRVLRVQPGARVTLFDGRGGEYPAEVLAVGKGAVTLQAGPRADVVRESPLTLHVAQSLSSGDRMDYTIQKAVELGATSIQPVATERSVVHLSGERATRRIAHWQAVAAAACAQCGRNVVPTIAPVLGYAAWLAALGAPAGDCRLMMSPAAGVRLRELPPPTGTVWLLCGPEGGLTPIEEQLAAHAGFTALNLGPRVLRTETAAVAALAAMQALWGDA